MQRVNSLLSAGVTLTSTGTAVASPIPRDSSGYFPEFVRVVATGAGCYVKAGNVGVTAVSGDCMVQPLDGIVLNVSGCKAISALTVSGTSSVTIVPLERGSWSYDLKTLDYAFTSMTSLPSQITFARADATTCATHFNSSGVLTTVAANVPRFDYDPVTLAPKGLLIEESRTNLLLHSRDMTQAAWSNTNVTPLRNQVGIDGIANSACLMTEGGAGTTISAQTTGAVTAGSTITLSAVFKRGNTDWVLLQLTESASVDGARAWFNLNTGVKGSTAAIGAGTSISSTQTSLGGGWYRCTLTCLPNGVYTLPRGGIYTASADTVANHVNAGTYIVDCAQLEVGSFATSYIPTTTASATRAADSASMTGTNFSSWYNQTQGTFVVEASQPTPSNSAGLISRSDGSFTDLLYGGSSIVRTRDNVPTSISSNNIGTSTAATVVKSAMSYDATGRSITAQGLAAVTGTYDLSYATIIGLNIGKNGGASTVLNGHIRRLSYYTTRLPNATLQALTA